MNHSRDASDRPHRDRRLELALLGFLGIAAFFLLTEHRAHPLGVLPFALLLLCPLLHVFMHRGHGTGDRSQHHHDSARGDSANVEGRWHDH